MLKEESGEEDKLNEEHSIYEKEGLQNRLSKSKTKIQKNWGMLKACLEH